VPARDGGPRRDRRAARRARTRAPSPPPGTRRDPPPHRPRPRLDRTALRSRSHPPLLPPEAWAEAEPGRRRPPPIVAVPLVEAEPPRPLGCGPGRSAGTASAAPRVGSWSFRSVPRAATEAGVPWPAVLRCRAPVPPILPPPGASRSVSARPENASPMASPANPTPHRGPTVAVSAPRPAARGGWRPSPSVRHARAMAGRRVPRPGRRRRPRPRPQRARPSPAGVPSPRRTSPARRASG
jgi:hypothetical protein